MRENCRRQPSHSHLRSPPRAMADPNHSSGLSAPGADCTFAASKSREMPDVPLSPHSSRVYILLPIFFHFCRPSCCMIAVRGGSPRGPAPRYATGRGIKSRNTKHLVAACQLSFDTRAWKAGCHLNLTALLSRRGRT